MKRHSIFCLIKFLSPACLLLAVQLEHPKLPAPYSTPSVNNHSRVVPRPEGTTLKLPKGFQIAPFSSNL